MRVSRIRGAVACATMVTAVMIARFPQPVHAGSSLAEVDAMRRAAGNRKPEAVRIGQALYRTVWPVQVRKVRVDGVGTHLVAGLVLTGGDFHGTVTPAQLIEEVVAIVNQTFASSSVEEVDVWAIVPLPTYVHEVVAGDLARPTSKTVFAVTVRRSEAATFADRVRRGDDVFWEADWRNSLAKD